MRQQLLAFSALTFVLGISEHGLAEPDQRPTPEPPAGSTPARETAADEDEVNDRADENAGMARNLGGHYFFPSDAVPDPFATTHFGQTTGVGLATLSENEVDDNGDPTGNKRKTSLAVLNLGMSAQLGFLDSIAVRGHISGGIFAGTSADAVLQHGISANYDFGLGATFSFPLGGHLRLGFGADVGWRNNLNVTILPSIIASIQQQSLVTESLLIKTKSIDIAGGPRLALGLGEAFGLTAFADFREAIQTVDLGSEDVSDNASALALGAAASLDFVAIPLGMNFAYATEIGLDSGSQANHTFALGLDYTGRASLALGVEGELLLVPLGGGADVTVYGAQFRMRYYW